MTALFVVITFVLFIVVDVFVLKLQKKKHPAFSANEAPPVFSKKNLIHEDDILLSPGHTWAKEIQSNLVRIGIDDFIMKALGSIKLHPVKKEGDTVRAGDVILVTSVADTNISFRAPIGGQIKEINPDAESLIKKWSMTILPDNIANDSKMLKKGSELKNWLFGEFTRLRDFINTNSHSPELVGVTMLDGGNIYEGAVSQMSNKVVQNFEKEFLTF